VATRDTTLVGVFVALALAATACRTAAGPSEGPPPPRIAQAVLLNGRPFPERPAFPREPPPPSRTFYVSAKAGSEGDGSRERPWKDLAAALRALSPGDRLRVAGGDYRGPIRVDEGCRAGTLEAPIQVIFENASFKESEGLPVWTVARPHWRFEGFAADLGEEPGPGFAAQGAEARGIVLDAALISGGAGAAVRIGAGAASVTIANSTFQPGGRGPSPAGALAIAVESGSKSVRLVGNLVLDRPSGGVRIGPAAGLAEASDDISGVNTISGSRAPAILVTGGSGIRISANTVVSNREGLEGRGIVVQGGSAVRIERNHVVDASVGVQVGWEEPRGTGHSRPTDVLVSRNYLERRAAAETAGVDIEAGHDVRVANNVLDDVSDAFLLFGAPPMTEGVVIANNLVLGVTGLAFRADSLRCAALFDGNVFSPRGPTISVEIGGKSLDLGRFLAGGAMPRSRLLPGVRIVHQDLGRIEGVRTRDAGLLVEGVLFDGTAPDLGVAER
jgi:hypothetical protein